MNSAIILTVVTKKDSRRIDQLLDQLTARIGEFERRFSRFLNNSELSNFNIRAGRRTTISKTFMEILTTAKSLSIQTNGLYNPLILPALQKAGYKGSWPNPGNEIKTLNFSDRAVLPATKIDIGRFWAQIPTNTAVDFGGLGKGYLLDNLADYLYSQDETSFWLSLGGDIICSGHDIYSLPWDIAVQGALNQGTNVASFSNNRGRKLAVATSGITKRNGIHNHKAWHHIIDPQSGEPAATGVLTVSVTADKAVIADVYAKCIVIGGEEIATTYKENRIIESFVVQAKGNSTKVKIIKG